jgi:hypothetical protein
MIMDTSSREHHLRTATRWQVSVFAPHGIIEGETETVSPTGALLCCKQLPPLEREFRMRLSPPHRAPLDVTARVVMTTIEPAGEGYRLGADTHFVTISEGDRQYLKSIIAKHYGGKLARLTQQTTPPEEAVAAQESKHTLPPQVVDIELPVSYNVRGKTVKAGATHFSTRGCILHTMSPPPLGTLFSLKLTIQDTGKSIQVDSSVIKGRRMAPGKPWDVVIRFMSLSAAEKQEIRKVLGEAKVNPKLGPRTKYLDTWIGQMIVKHLGRKKARA